MIDASGAICAVVSSAGGKLVGKTRLQKTCFVLEMAGVGFGFSFSYHYYGPYSDEVSEAAYEAKLDGLVNEVEETAQWGGKYSIYLTASSVVDESEFAAARRKIVSIANRANPVDLEIAATAAFIRAEEHVQDYWAETRRRKPQKATDGVIASAKKLWSELREVQVPRPLPEI